MAEWDAILAEHSDDDGGKNVGENNAGAQKKAQKKAQEKTTGAMWDATLSEMKELEGDSIFQPSGALLKVLREDPKAFHESMNQTLEMMRGIMSTSEENDARPLPCFVETSADAHPNKSYADVVKGV